MFLAANQEEKSEIAESQYRRKDIPRPGLRSYYRGYGGPRIISGLEFIPGHGGYVSKRRGPYRPGS